MSPIHLCLELLGCRMCEKVLFRMTASFHFKIPFYNLNFGYDPKSLVPFGILNIQPNENLIEVSQLNSKYSQCSFKARGEIEKPQSSRARRTEIICLQLGIYSTHSYSPTVCWVMAALA